MARLLLLGGSYVARSIIANVQKCLNLYPELNTKDAPVPVTYYQRPGFRPLAQAQIPPEPPPPPTPPPPDPPPPAECGCGTVIAVGDNGVVLRWTDQIGFFTSIAPGAAAGIALNSIAFQAGTTTPDVRKWMACGNDLIIVSEDDGLTWTSITPPAAAVNWLYVAGSGMFSQVMLMSVDRIFFSSDWGATWSEVVHGLPAHDFIGCAMGIDGTGILIRAGGTTVARTALSTDRGQSWTAVDFDNGYGEANRISRLPGSAWSSSSLPSLTPREFVIGLNQPGIAYSPDGAGAVTATGSIGFDFNPSDGDTITLNGGVFTFVTAGATGAEVNIEASLGLTLLAAKTVLDGLGAPYNDFTYDVNSFQILLSAATPGAAGNALTIAASAAFPDNPTLQGGVDTTWVLESHTGYTGPTGAYGWNGEKFYGYAEGSATQTYSASLGDNPTLSGAGDERVIHDMVNVWNENAIPGPFWQFFVGPHTDSVKTGIYYTTGNTETLIPMVNPVPGSVLRAVQYMPCTVTD